MLHAFTELVAPAAMERLTLLINHVVAGEPQAGERMRVHAGRTLLVRQHGMPGWLPAAPAYAVRVTPAGLFEWCGLQGTDEPDLRLTLDASNPARLALQSLTGQTPEVQIEGDARLAADVNWLVANLRWDAAADLEKAFGPVAAQALVTAGKALGSGLRAALQGAESLAGRFKA